MSLYIYTPVICFAKQIRSKVWRRYLLLLFASLLYICLYAPVYGKNGHKFSCYYGINEYQLCGPGRVDIIQKRSERGNNVQSYADRFDVKVNNIKLCEVNNRIMQYFISTIGVKPSNLCVGSLLHFLSNPVRW